MRNLYSLAALLLLNICSFAQNSNAVLFTENGERFQVVLNGVIQNTEPATNVKLTDLMAPNYKMKILFENKALGEIDKNLFLEAFAETTFNIKRKSNGEWVVRILSITPIAQLPPTPQNVPNQNVVIYHANPYPPATTTTTTTTTYNDPFMNDNVNINLGINGVGLNMNINGSGVGTTTSQTTTTYTTTTTTAPPPVYDPNPVFTTPPPVYNTPPPTTVVVQEPVYVMPGYNGPTGCPFPMYPQDFAGIKASIMSKSFESTKLEIAKQVLGQRCMTSAQVAEMMMCFDFEATRLDFAKFAYGRTFDLGNYYMVNDAFTFESSINDLNNYINTYRR